MLADGRALRLPFPAVAIEFENTAFAKPLPTILLASEVSAEDGRPLIRILASEFYSDENQWGTFLPMHLEAEDFAKKIDGTWAFKLHQEEAQRLEVISPFLVGFFNFAIPFNAGYGKVHKAAKPKVRKSLLKKKGALPLEVYYTLLIDPLAMAAASTVQGGTHASPREHTRRGHVRVYSTGKTVWVSASLVNKGAPGKIHKTYEVRA
jgi:hypothetical protein